METAKLEQPVENNAVALSTSRKSLLRAAYQEQRLGRVEAARSMFESFLRFHPDDPAAWMSMGVLARRELGHADRGVAVDAHVEVHRDVGRRRPAHGVRPGVLGGRLAQAGLAGVDVQLEDDVDRLIEVTREPEAICQRAVEPFHVESSGAAIMRPATGDFWACWGRPEDNEYDHVPFAANG